MVDDLDQAGGMRRAAAETVSTQAIGARLDEMALSGWHRRIVTLIGLGSFFTFFEIALGSFFGVLLAGQWSLTTLDLSMVISAAFVGEMLGSLLLAPAADRYGRRTLFQFNLIAYAVCSLATAFSPNLTVFLVLRVLTGIGLGAELTLVDTYLSELLPRRRRGRYIAWSYTLGLLAIPAVGGLSKAATGVVFGVAGWRWLLIIAACGATGVWLLRRRLPESPRWLATTGNLARADQVLTEIERNVRCTAVSPAPAVSVPELLVPESSVPEPSGSPGESAASPAAEVARADVASAREPAEVPRSASRYRHRAVMLWTIQILGPVGFYGFASIAPIVLMSKGIDLAHSLTYSALIATGYPLGSLVSVYLAEHVQRRTLLIACTLTVAAFGTLFGLSSNITLVIGAGIASSVTGIMQSNVSHIYQAELFHTANRSTAIGIPYAASRLVGALLPFVSLTVLAALGAGPLYAGCAVLLTGMALIIKTLGPRTNNRALDTI